MRERGTTPKSTSTTTMFVGKTYLTKLLTLLVTISSLLGHSAAASSADKDDAAVMAKIAKSLTPTPSGWLGPNPCDWSGVACDSSGHITSISLASKSLAGVLPSELNNLSHLKSLSVKRNQLSGSFPSLSNLPSLQQAFLDNNNFSSIPSPFLSGLTSLQILSISENPNLPPWMIPETLADSTTLNALYAGQANIMGTMPDIFGSFPNLQNVKLSYNKLTGPLPTSFAKSSIQNLWLNNQETGLSGTLQVLGEMSQLTQAWLHQNQFSGPIPDLSGCTSLFDLSLRDNKLTGPVPSSLSTLPKLVNISLQNNKLQGPMPSFPRGVLVNLGITNNFCSQKPEPCDPQVMTLLEIVGAFGYPVDLAESWSGNNPCEGWKSVSCDNEGSVTVLNLGKQGWIGTISPAIANLPALTTLLLNDNNLTGTIPSELTKLAQLRLLDVSNNNVSGIVPAFGSGVTLKTSGNPFIEKIVDTGDGSPSNRQSPSGGTSDSSVGTHKSSDSPWIIVVIVIVALTFIVVLSFMIYRRVVKKRSGELKKLKIDSELPSQTIGDISKIQVHDGGNLAIPIEVLREVTENFSNDNILGQGGFGVVYKGQLHDGTQIAVKRMGANVVSSKGLSEFQAEIAVLSKVRHRHLVALIGFCVNGYERLLVYEYMPQGTLAQHLFDHREMGFPPLTWKQRVSIALDVARGVEYLHSLAQQSFIHRDLKPSNILLGDDMRAKVSDFGLVKNAPDGKFSVETRLAGTFGYMAPEYASTGRVTTKIDVFAFGIVLMEIITGRKALDESLPEEKSHLGTWFPRILNNKGVIRESLDPTLEPVDGETFGSICIVTELAGHCTVREPLQRPDMGHAVTVLSPLVRQWKPATHHEENFNMDMNLPHAMRKWRADEGLPTMTSDYTTLGPSEASTFNS